MSSPVVVDGTVVVFEPMFGQRQVVLSEPAGMSGSGEATIDQRRVCVVGDEKRVQCQAQYFIPGYAPGTGIVSVETLDGSQMAPCVTSGAPLILMGQKLVARFTPTVPAIMSSPPNSADSMAPSMGHGCFLPQQTLVSVG
ncbi:hypothetical protein [Paraburkholderia domus]|uniref:hypothetical protein n=1 Tax=Paraburkholderia domus TaxID=2793075 RepID=UPI00191226F7|nr:hypothetical protein [Paraburkholderia domus]MBK5182413.1 hypothetical protein [Burkholderia sp. R-69749]MCI0147320.1 hypothetical protein [Paraburkholderia sediminicola]CAE6844046.1 hypothetical protein R69749_04591 [Paraburkholderia domus]CAE6920903.1 hypothetical protein R75471_04169 [Paraburkholderia domus]